VKTVVLLKLQLFVILSLCASTANADYSFFAAAMIKSCDSARVSGRVFLLEEPSDEGIKEVKVHMVVKGLSPGKHAVHIHETASCEPCSSAGGHFDPGPNSNTSPDGNHPFHAGDLINLRVSDNRVGRMRITTSRISLSSGPLSIFDEDGSAFIVHANPDSYCPEGAVPGCAGGARAACGIIERY